MSFIPNSITLAALAKVMKQSVAEVEAEAATLDFYVGTSWCGELAIAEDDAHQLVSGSARRAQAHAAAWNEHLRAAEEWQIRRDQLVRQAQADAELEARRDGIGAGAASQAGLEAAREVGRRYETTTPPPSWQGDSSVASRLYTDDKPGLVDRARTLISGSPR